MGKRWDWGTFFLLQLEDQRKEGDALRRRVAELERAAAAAAEGRAAAAAEAAAAAAEAKAEAAERKKGAAAAAAEEEEVKEVGKNFKHSMLTYYIFSLFFQLEEAVKSIRFQVRINKNNFSVVFSDH